MPKRGGSSGTDGASPLSPAPVSASASVFGPKAEPGEVEATDWTVGGICSSRRCNMVDPRRSACIKKSLKVAAQSVHQSPSPSKYLAPKLSNSGHPSRMVVSTCSKLSRSTSALTTKPTSVVMQVLLLLLLLLLSTLMLRRRTSPWKEVFKTCFGVDIAVDVEVAVVDRAAAGATAFSAAAELFADFEVVAFLVGSFRGWSIRYELESDLELQRKLPLAMG
mmetsp:Transcript_53155/g.113537  ORF Transcript_53155/g.113537 Transcript_53155/m.113537 type:complete len:221 (+) Transcript_53155:261-923(+)